jgi:predicted RNA-binding Zn-ribbon protein involved in translation (DUF1610 family)
MTTTTTLIERELNAEALNHQCPTCPAVIGNRCRVPRHWQGTPGRVNWRTLPAPHPAA